MCRASQIVAGKDVGVFLFYFFTFKSFSGSIFDMQLISCANVVLESLK